MGAMSTYVLCHGSWYAPSTWERVSARQARAGHQAVAVSYPEDPQRVWRGRQAINAGA